MAAGPPGGPPEPPPDADPVDALLATPTSSGGTGSSTEHATTIRARAPAVGRHGEEGLKLASFNRLATVDLGWVPGDLDQYRHGILRPDQTRDTWIVHGFHRGMVDGYMAQLCRAKADAIDNAIDGQRTTFDDSKWKDYRTFALEMLREEGTPSPRQRWSAAISPHEEPPLSYGYYTSQSRGVPMTDPVTVDLARGTVQAKHPYTVDTNRIIKGIAASLVGQVQ